jgi:AraC-like DNA-binding protein
MLRARDIDAFVAARFGHYLVGRHYLVWCSDPMLGGVVFWGVPDERDVDELARVFAIEPTSGYDVVSDGRRIERVSRAAFDPFARSVVKRLREQRRLLRRNVMIVPHGLIGTVMAGFFPLFGLSDSGFRVFTDAGEAFGWLGRADVLDEVERIVTAELGEAPIVAELHGWLVEHLRDATVDAAARRLARSPRSLQRELGAAKTTFSRELDRARVRAARQRLADSDDKLATIANDVGCISGATFSTLFRRLTGETPSGYRSRSRR